MGAAGSPGHAAAAIDIYHSHAMQSNNQPLIIQGAMQISLGTLESLLGFLQCLDTQGSLNLSTFTTLWNGWLIERLVCGNNGCFVSERERRSNRLNPACARLLFAPASATQRKDRTNGDAKTTKPPVTALIRHRH